MFDAPSISKEIERRHKKVRWWIDHFHMHRSISHFRYWNSCPRSMCTNADEFCPLFGLLWLPFCVRPLWQTYFQTNGQYLMDSFLQKPALCMLCWSMKAMFWTNLADLELFTSVPRGCKQNWVFCLCFQFFFSWILFTSFQVIGPCVSNSALRTVFWAAGWDIK